MKIQIIGFSGSGKSTLAKILANHYKVPALYLDTVKFYGDWQERTNEEQNEIVKEFINKNEDGWVIDGNYSGVAMERFYECDKIIFLNYNRVYCYFQALKRYRLNKNKVRENFPCTEKFDFEFQWWLIHEGRTRKKRKKHLENLNKSKGEKLIFKSRKSLLKYLKENNINTNI